MKNTVPHANWRPGDSDRELEIYLDEIRRALNASYFGVWETVTTLTATATTIWTETMPTDSVWDVEFVVGARATDGSRAAYRRISRFSRATAGAALMSTDSVGTDQEDVAGWDVTVAASGQAARLQVTGDAARTVNWKALVRVLEVR